MEQGRGEGLGSKPEGYVGTTTGKRGDVEATARESLPEPRRSRVLERASTRWRERQVAGEGISNSPRPSIDVLREHQQFPQTEHRRAERASTIPPNQASTC